MQLQFFMSIYMSIYCRGVWHLHPTTLNEAVDASGKRDLISLVYLQTTWSAWALSSAACDHD